MITHIFYLLLSIVWLYYFSFDIRELVKKEPMLLILLIFPIGLCCICFVLNVLMIISLL